MDSRNDKKHRGQVEGCKSKKTFKGKCRGTAAQANQSSCMTEEDFANWRWWGFLLSRKYCMGGGVGFQVRLLMV